MHLQLEVSHNLLTMPWQNLAGYIRDAGSRARNATAPARTAIDPISEIDTNTLAKVHKQFDSENRRILVHINAAAPWTEKAKHDANSNVISKCPHCCHEGQTWAHTLQCPGLAPQLRHLLPLPEDFELERLPLHLRIAIPDAIVPNTDRTFWGQTGNDFQDLPDSTRRILGIKEYIQPLYATGPFTDHLASKCAANGFAQPGSFRNARQIAAALRNSNGIHDNPGREQLQPAFFHAGDSPEVPNVYTDGGLMHPSQVNWQLGTYATWHPQRVMQSEPVSDFELDNASLRVQPNGIALAGKLADFASSSTRLEIAAGVLAMARPQPISVLSDSASFLKKANAILINPFAKQSKPWPLQTNGDL